MHGPSERSTLADGLTQGVLFLDDVQVDENGNIWLRVLEARAAGGVHLWYVYDSLGFPITKLRANIPASLRPGGGPPSPAHPRPRTLARANQNRSRLAHSRRGSAIGTPGSCSSTAEAQRQASSTSLRKAVAARVSRCRFMPGCSLLEKLPRC